MNMKPTAKSRSISLRTWTLLLAGMVFWVTHSAAASSPSDSWLTMPWPQYGRPAASPGGTLQDFPRLSTAAGQFALLEKLYPEDRDLSVRRDAFEKTMLYFPKDQRVHFYATVQIADIDRQDHHFSQAVDALNSIMDASQHQFEPDFYSIGEYVLALTIWDEGRTADALAMFQRLADTPGLSFARQSCCRFCAAVILENDSPTKAAALLLQNIPRQSYVRGQSVTLLSEILSRTGATDQLTPILKRFFAEDSPDVDTAVVFFPATRLSLPPDKAAALLKIIDQCSAGSKVAASAALVLKSYREKVGLVNAYAPLQQELKSFVAASPPMDFQKLSGPEPVRVTSHYYTISLAGVGQRYRWAWDAPARPLPADTDNALRYAMDLLTQADPDSDFSYNLITATGIITRELGAEGKTRYEGLMTEFISLCDRLPADDPNYGAGVGFRGIVAEHRGDLQGAGKIYEAALNGKLSEAWKINTETNYGHVLGKLGKYTEALAAYKAGEPTAKVTFNGPYMITPVLLNLELGNRQEALRILSVVEKVPLAQRGESECAELAALAARGKATEYWDAAANWWPAWEALEQKLGIKPVDPKASLFAENNLRNINADLGAAVAANDRDAYMELLRIVACHARWEPDSAVQLWSWVIQSTRKIAPETEGDFCRFLLTLTDNFPTDVPGYIRKIASLRASCYLRLGMNQNALDYCAQFLAHDTGDDAVTEDMVRFEGQAALALGQKPALAAAVIPLEQLLDSGKLTVARVADVWVLDSLYRALGSEAEEEALLKHELLRPDTGENPEDLQRLKERYASIAQTGDESTRLSDSVNAWLAKNKPDWYDYARPAGLKGPQFQNLAEVVPTWINEVELGKRPAAEAAKLNWLIAGDPTQPFLFKVQAFRNAFSLRRTLCRTVAEAEQLTASLDGPPALPDIVRVPCVGQALMDAAMRGDRKEVEHYNALPFVKGLTGKTRAAWDSCLGYVRTDRTSGSEIEKACGALMAKPMSGVDLAFAGDYAKSLIILGQWEPARKIANGLGSAQYQPDVTDSGGSQEMQLLQEIGSAQANEGMNRALMAVVIKYFPGPPPAEEPPVVSALRDKLNTRFLSQEEARQVLLYHVRTRRVFGDTLAEWFPLMGILSFSTDGKACFHEMAHVALGNAANDGQRAAIIEDLLGVTDLDTRSERDWLSAELKPYRGDASQNESFGRVRMADTDMALRNGGPVDLEASFQGINNPHLRAHILTDKLVYYVNTQNLAALKNVVMAEQPEELAHEAVRFNIPALDALGMTDQAALARKAAKNQFYRSILKSWSTSDCSQVRYIATLADVIGNTPLPEQWLEAIGRSENLEDKLWVGIQQARAREDWATAATLSAQAETLPSNENDYIWYEAEALYKAGKKDEAAKSLENYIRRAIPDYHYIEASQLLQQLRPTAAALLRKSTVAGNN